MIIEAFLICALSLPAVNFTHPALISYHLVNKEEEQLKDWLKKHHDIEEVFITPKGQANTLKENGWEQMPFSINDKEIWIQRRPKSDKKIRGAA